MTSDTHDLEALGSYVLGGLDEDDSRSVEEHLAGCEGCREERIRLEEMTAALGELPPEAFLDGPPRGGDLLLQRILQQVRRESARQNVQRRAAISAAAGVMVIAALGTGVLLGRSQERSSVVAVPPAGPAAPTVAGTLVGSRTDPGSGARLIVRVTPAAGWVRVNAAVSGIPAGQRCRVWVVAENGTREQAGSWLVSAKGAQEGVALDGAALVAPADVAAVEVANVAGRRFVSVPL